MQMMLKLGNYAMTMTLKLGHCAPVEIGFCMDISIAS